MTFKTPTLARLGPWILPGAALCAVILAPGAGTLAAPGRHLQTASPVPGQASQTSQPPQRQSTESPQQTLPSPRRASRRDYAFWKDEQLKTQLGLTARQVRRIDQIYQQRAKELMPLVAEWTKQRDEVDRLIRERTVTAEQLDIQLLRFQALNSKFWESRQLMLYRIYLVLTPEQYKKLLTVQRGRGRRGGGGTPR